MPIPYESLYGKVQIILTSKVEEFHYFGYVTLTEQDLWSYCIDKIWRKQEVSLLKLHELASGIFNVRASEMINYMQINGLKQSAIDIELSPEELQGLFQPLSLSLSKNKEK